jgi:hypothetical protein
LKSNSEAKVWHFGAGPFFANMMIISENMQMHRWRLSAMIGAGRGDYPID